MRRSSTTASTSARCRSIQLDPANPQRVRLLFAIERGTPIKQDTVAVLKTQGLTGIAYVELSGGAADSPPLVASGAGEYPRDPHQALAERAAGEHADHRADQARPHLEQHQRRAQRREPARAEQHAARPGRRRRTRSRSARTRSDAGIAAAARTFDHSAQAMAQAGPVIERIGRGADAVETMGREAARPARRPDRPSRAPAPSCSASAPTPCPNCSACWASSTTCRSRCAA